jgi:hypothetical protein
MLGFAQHQSRGIELVGNQKIPDRGGTDFTDFCQFLQLLSVEL